MKTLSFENRATVQGGKAVRRARFEERSAVPLSAACLVANGVRETLANALGTAVSIEVLEPIVPDAATWSAIAAGARVLTVPGPTADVSFVLRPSDALALAGAAFSEGMAEQRSLSPLEEAVVLRTLRAIAGCLGPVTGGRETTLLEAPTDVRQCSSYFELLFERPVRARLGVALSREPQAQPAPSITLRALEQIRVVLDVDFARGSITGAQLLALQPGDVIALDSPIDATAVVRLGRRMVCRGQSGAVAGRRAVVVQ
ncbi:MAG: FliM/FliN family flagellar motor switch protein [Candidatus Eremiobacteraeota bacterium]|nr:FliM/FliN family flagellar motor switch protein [Candidatus Eremiobacteraeota bacterium]